MSDQIPPFLKFIIDEARRPRSAREDEAAGVLFSDTQRSGSLLPSCIKPSETRRARDAAGARTENASLRSPNPSGKTPPATRRSGSRRTSPSCRSCCARLKITKRLRRRP
jgi:hypothetical protein